MTSAGTALVLFGLAVGLAAGGQTHVRELTLAPGIFAPLPATHLGQSVRFENEIDLHVCFPLLRWEKTVTWLTRAHTVANRLFVRRCLPDASVGLVTVGNEPGGASDTWELASLDANGQLQFTSLRLPEWTFMANPAFCDSYVAYWGLGHANTLSALIYDLVGDTLVVSETLGPVILETDNEEYLPRPGWDSGCSQASFDGGAAKRRRIELKPRSSTQPNMRLHPAAAAGRPR